MNKTIAHMHNVTRCAKCNKVIKDTETMKLNIFTGEARHKGCK